MAEIGKLKMPMKGKMHTFTDCSLPQSVFNSPSFFALNSALHLTPRVAGKGYTVEFLTMDRPGTSPSQGPPPSCELLYSTY